MHRLRAFLAVLSELKIMYTPPPLLLCGPFLSPSTYVLSSLHPQRQDVRGLARAHRGRRSAFALERRASLRRAMCQGRVHGGEDPFVESEGDD